MKKLHFNIKGRFFLAVFLPLVITFAALTVVLNIALGRVMDKSAQEMIELQTHVLSKEITQSIYALQMWLKNVSNYPRLQNNMTSEQMAVWLEGHFLDYPAVIVLIYVQEDGMTMSMGKGKKAQLKNYTDRSYYKAILTEQKTNFFISETLISRATGLPAVVLAHSVKDANGKVRGMLALSINIEKLTSLVSKGSEIYSHQESIEHIWILDQTGSFISDTKEGDKKKLKLENSDQLGYTTLKDHSQEVLNSATGFFKSKNNLNQNIGVSWETIKETPNWKMGMTISTKKFDAQTTYIILLVSVIAFIGVVLLGIIFYFVIQKQMSPIDKSLALAQNIAQLDLTQKIDEKTLRSQDELGELSRAMNQMSILLREIIHDVRLSSDNVTSSSQELNTTSQTISQGSAEQAATLEQVAAAIVEMTAAIKENAQNAQNTEQIAQQSSQMAEAGGQAVLKTVESMQQVSEKISVIQEIAGQTRLLSLNASIEAARAGNSGRGFAVVASEVSKLAELSSLAATEIEKLTSGSMQVAHVAGEKLHELVPQIKHTAQLVAQITHSSREQEISVEQINNSVQEANTVVQSNALLSEKMAANASHSAQYAEQLRNIVNKFKV